MRLFPPILSSASMKSHLPIARPAVAIWLAWTAVLAAQSAITLDPKTAKWSVDGREVPVRSVISPVAEGVLRGGLRIGTDAQGDLVATNEPGGREDWRLKAEKGRALMPVYLSDDAVFFQTWTRPAKESDEAAKIADSRSLRRVSIKTGDESAPYAMPAETAKDESVAAVVLDGGMVFAVASAPDPQRDQFYEHSLRHARVVAWNDAGGQPIWSKLIEYRGAASPGAGLLSPGGPAYATTDLCLLTAGPGMVFACTGPHDAITAFDQKTGQVKWTQPEVWEYRRGFIGPSVWSHFIARFASEDDRHGGNDSPESDRQLRGEAVAAVRHELGLHEGEPNKTSPDFQQRIEKKVAALKEKRKQRKADLAARCRIIGGPVFVGTGDAARVFVAVSEADGPWMGYVANRRVRRTVDLFRQLSC